VLVQFDDDRGVEPRCGHRWHHHRHGLCDHAAIS
jgi:hypothetical protein